jgi:serine/threonine protein kinase, bacterial
VDVLRRTRETVPEEYCTRFDLHESNLTGANFYKVNLARAILYRANLTGANLQGAKVTGEQLADAQSLQGTIMPNGKKYEDWLKSRRENGN